MGRLSLSFVSLVVLLGAVGSRPAASQSLADASAQPMATWIDQEMPSLLETYRSLHLHPELSFDEQQTASTIARLWRQAGFEVTTDFGGHGVVGILRNGDGPTLMLRCDLDALPVTEQTQLPYASTRTVEVPGSGNTGVMHACGHDVHMTNLVGTARYLASHRDAWAGTLMLVGQPAEERGAGAKAMLEEGLFDRFPRPDYALALHVSGDTATGTVAIMPGYALANVDNVDIEIKGRGGHGSAPETTIDPVVQAAQLIMALQTIVSREIKPTEPAVVTVGSIHGGTKHNIIGDRCHLQLTVRSYSDEVREQVLSAIRRKAKAVAQGFGAPDPDITVSEGTPSLKNDAQLSAHMREVFAAAIGAENVQQDQPMMVGEDFSRYGRAGVPILLYRLGSISPERLNRFESLGLPLPSLHSGHYYPDVEPTLRTGMTTMISGALSLLPPQPR